MRNWPQKRLIFAQKFTQLKSVLYMNDYDVVSGEPEV